MKREDIEAVRADVATSESSENVKGGKGEESLSARSWINTMKKFGSSLMAKSSKSMAESRRRRRSSKRRRGDGGGSNGSLDHPSGEMEMYSFASLEESIKRHHANISAENDTCFTTRDLKRTISLKGLNDLHAEQKPVWEFWAKTVAKPRSKVQWWNLINRSLPFPWLIILANGLWTTAVVLCIELLPGTEVSNFLREAQFMEAIGITTFFLSIALGFRLNQAYQRWWEARMLWGRMINRCRQLSFQSLTYIEEPNLALRICLWVLISSDLLRLHLRGRRELGLLQVIMDMNISGSHPPGFITIDEYELIQEAGHRVTISHWKITQLLKDAREKELVSPLVHYKMNEILLQLHTIIGGMERILRCPMPIGYTHLMRLAIILWMIGLPLGLVAGEFFYWSIPVDVIIAYFFTGMEELASQLENPFGIDPNDLPLEQFTSTLRNHIFEMMSSFQGQRSKSGRRAGAAKAKRKTRYETEDLLVVKKN